MHSAITVIGVTKDVAPSKSTRLLSKFFFVDMSLHDPTISTGLPARQHTLVTLGLIHAFVDSENVAYDEVEQAHGQDTFHDDEQVDGPG